MKKTLLEQMHLNLARAIMSGKREVTMDDATLCGTLAVDPNHDPNAKQNALGHVLPSLRNKGYLQKSGRETTSQSKDRKGGSIKIWLVLSPGVAWARSITQDADDEGQDTPRPPSRVHHVVRRQPDSDVSVEDVPIHAQRRIVRGRPSRA